jgi:hypothetical protein
MNTFQPNSQDQQSTDILLDTSMVDVSHEKTIAEEEQLQNHKCSTKFGKEQKWKLAKFGNSPCNLASVDRYNRHIQADEVV